VLSCNQFCNLRETFHSFAIAAARNSRKIPPFDPKCWNIGGNGEKCITSLIFMRWRHSHMRAIFGYTPSQLRYTPKLKSIDHGLLQILPFEICPFNTLSRDPRWRHTNSKLLIQFRYSIYVCAKFDWNQSLFNWQNGSYKTRVQSLWDFGYGTWLNYSKKS